MNGVMMLLLPLLVSTSVEINSLQWVEDMPYILVTDVEINSLQLVEDMPYMLSAPDTLRNDNEVVSYLAGPPDCAYQYYAAKLTAPQAGTIIAVVFGYGTNPFTSPVAQTCSFFIWQDVADSPGSRLIAGSWELPPLPAGQGALIVVELPPGHEVPITAGDFWVGTRQVTPSPPHLMMDNVPNPTRNKFSSDSYSWTPVPPPLGNFFIRAVVRYGAVAEPDIRVVPTSFHFALVAGGADTTATIQVHNDGTADLSVTSISHSSTWLSASPTSFTVSPGASQTVNIVANATGLSPGTYYDTLKIWSNDPNENPVNIPVVLVVSEPGEPDIQVRPSLLSFTGEGLDTDTLWVMNIGGADLSVSDITHKIDWIFLVSPTSFTVTPGDSQMVTVVANAADVEPGAYLDSIQIHSNDPDENPYIVQVMLEVGVEESELVIDNYQLSLSPNPVIDVLTIEYQLQTRTAISLRIYNLAGQEVALLLNKVENPGTYQFEWEHGLCPGIYFVKLSVGQATMSQKIVVVH